jgi:hypothetical protein
MVRSFDFHHDGNITQASFRFPYVFFIPGLLLPAILEIEVVAQMGFRKQRCEYRPLALREEVLNGKHRTKSIKQT